MTFILKKTYLTRDLIIIFCWIKSERISAAESLQHPFFDPIRDAVEQYKQKKDWKLWLKNIGLLIEIS